MIEKKVLTMKLLVKWSLITRKLIMLYFGQGIVMTEWDSFMVLVIIKKCRFRLNSTLITTNVNKK